MVQKKDFNNVMQQISLDIEKQNNVIRGLQQKKNENASRPDEVDLDSVKSMISNLESLNSYVNKTKDNLSSLFGLKNNSTVNESNVNSNKSSQTVKESNDNVKESNDNVEELNDTVEESNDTVEESNDTVEESNDTSEESNNTSEQSNDTSENKEKRVTLDITE